MRVKATYVSVWDGGYQVVTECDVDMTSGSIETDSVDAGDVEVLDREYVEFNGKEFEVVDYEGEYVIKDMVAFKDEVITRLSRMVELKDERITELSESSGCGMM